jgi:hypothetical protein
MKYNHRLDVGVCGEHELQRHMWTTWATRKYVYEHGLLRYGQLEFLRQV